MCLVFDVMLLPPCAAFGAGPMEGPARAPPPPPPPLSLGFYWLSAVRHPLPLGGALAPPPRAVSTGVHVAPKNTGFPGQSGGGHYGVGYGGGEGPKRPHLRGCACG